jgi:predicted HNH restriction endonuclease
MPLNPLAFNKIVDLVGGWDSLELEEFTQTYPDEITEGELILEGAKKQITVNAYERNPIARQKCLEYNGYICTVCTFISSDMYGEIGNDFIHVHHLKELNQIGEEYEVDSINDLRPVCPNCHSMLHKRKPAYYIEEIKSFIR